MMPQRAENESIYEQADLPYGKYKEDQSFAHRTEWSSEAQLARETSGEKVYPQPHNHKNMYRLGMFLIAMVMLLICAFLFIFFFGGTGGWVSFIVAAFVIFLITVVAIDKIE